MSRMQAPGQAQRGVPGAGPRPARRARRAVLRPGRRRPADRGGRGHPVRVRDHRADRHPGRVPRHRADPGVVRDRIRGDDPAHRQRRRLLRVHRPGDWAAPAGVAAALVALLAYTFLQVGLYGAFGPNAASRGRRPPAPARGLVGVGAGRLGHRHRARPGRASTSPARCWASC